jgi:hypothetical protein
LKDGGVYMGAAFVSNTVSVAESGVARNLRH